MFDTHLFEAFVLVLLVSGVPLLISTVGGLIVAVLQTATQIQEQTLTHVVKFGLVSLVLLVCGDYFLERMMIYFDEAFRSMVYMGKL